MTSCGLLVVLFAVPALAQYSAPVFATATNGYPQILELSPTDIKLSVLHDTTKLTGIDPYLNCVIKPCGRTGPRQPPQCVDSVPDATRTNPCDIAQDSPTVKGPTASQILGVRQKVGVDTGPMGITQALTAGTYYNTYCAFSTKEARAAACDMVALGIAQQPAVNGNSKGGIRCSHGWDSVNNPAIGGSNAPVSRGTLDQINDISNWGANALLLATPGPQSPRLGTKVLDSAELFATPGFVSSGQTGLSHTAATDMSQFADTSGQPIITSQAPLRLTSYTTHDEAVACVFAPPCSVDPLKCNPNPQEIALGQYGDGTKALCSARSVGTPLLADDGLGDGYVVSVNPPDYYSGCKGAVAYKQVIDLSGCVGLLGAASNFQIWCATETSEVLSNLIVYSTPGFLKDPECVSVTDLTITITTSLQVRPSVGAATHRCVAVTRGSPAPTAAQIESGLDGLGNIAFSSPPVTGPHSTGQVITTVFTSLNQGTPYDIYCEMDGQIVSKKGQCSTNGFMTNGALAIVANSVVGTDAAVQFTLSTTDSYRCIVQNASLSKPTAVQVLAGNGADDKATIAQPPTSSAAASAAGGVLQTPVQFSSLTAGSRLTAYCATSGETPSTSVISNGVTFTVGSSSTPSPPSPSPSPPSPSPSGIGCSGSYNSSSCNYRGTCTESFGIPVCSCNAGWSGSQCQSAVSSCYGQSCSGNGVCTNGATTSMPFVCRCNFAWCCEWNFCSAPVGSGSGPTPPIAIPNFVVDVDGDGSNWGLWGLFMLFAIPIAICAVAATVYFGGAFNKVYTPVAVPPTTYSSVPVLQY